MKECPYCLKDIVQIDNRRPKVYCNDKCRGLHWRLTKAAKNRSYLKIKEKVKKIPTVKPVHNSDYLIDLLS